MQGEKLVNSVTQTDSENVRAVRSPQGCGDFAKHVRRLLKAAAPDLGANHIAHGHHGDTCRNEHGSKFTLARPRHAANGNNLRHGLDATVNAQEDTCKNWKQAQFENSARPHSRSINFHKTAEANIKPTEMAIIPMYPC